MRAKVLIVEDEMIVAHNLRLALKRLGYEVAGIAVSGEQAIQMALQTAPDLILMHIQLQGKMDGVEAAEKIQSQLQAAVVYVTANTDAGTLQRAKLTEPLGYLCKPFEDWNLRVTLEIALHNHQTRLALQASEERFRQIAETIDEVFWIADIHLGQTYYVSPAYERVWGRSVASLYENSRSFLEGIHPEDRERVTAALTGQRAGQAFAHEYRVVRPDGSVRYVADSGFPVRSKAGQVTHYLGVARDITERKAAEEKSREQAALLQITRDAIFVRDLESRVLFWNQGAERVYGWKAAEVTGRKTSEFLYDPGLLLELARTEETVKRSGEWRGELQQRSRDGRTVIVESRAALVRDQAGQPKSILCVNTDITEEKAREHAFLRAQRLESIGTLAAGIAHDLNNILAPILMASQILQLESEDKDTAEIMATIHTSAKRGAEVVRQVLTFGRGLDGARVQMQPRHLLKEMLRIMQETFPRNITVEATVPKDLWMVRGDATQLHQVLLNLCVNARDAMPNGGTLHLKARNVEHAVPAPNAFGQAGTGPHVVVEVGDTGQGIAPEIVDKIAG